MPLVMRDDLLLNCLDISLGISMVLLPSSGYPLYFLLDLFYLLWIVCAVCKRSVSGLSFFLSFFLC